MLASLNLLDCSQHLEFVLREEITVVAMALLALKLDTQSISLNFFYAHPEYQRQGFVNQTYNNSMYSDQEQSEYDTDNLSDYDCETEEDFLIRNQNTDKWLTPCKKRLPSYRQDTRTAHCLAIIVL